MLGRPAVLTVLRPRRTLAFPLRQRECYVRIGIISMVALPIVVVVVVVVVRVFNDSCGVLKETIFRM